MSTRDLDAWADALNVDNDEDAFQAVGSLVAVAAVASDSALDLARLLGGLVEESYLTSAARCLDEAVDALLYAARRFDRHERGIG